MLKDSSITDGIHSIQKNGDGIMGMVKQILHPAVPFQHFVFPAGSYISLS
jgi:hypothetical protein